MKISVGRFPAPIFLPASAYRKTGRSARPTSVFSAGSPLALLAVLSLGCPPTVVPAAEVQSLAGTWRFQLKAFSLLPRQDGNRNGWIKEYAIYVSTDGTPWGEPAAKGNCRYTADPTLVVLPQPVEGRFVKLVALSPFDKQPFASLAEFDAQIDTRPDQPRERE
jgi:hypothetical protein